MDPEDKIRGAMLGGALGDAIGELAFRLGDRAALTAAVDRRPSLVYTDDTAMAIGVAEVLVAHGGLDPETLGRRFHDNYRREPWRGYRHFTLEERCRLRALMGLRLRVSEMLGLQNSNRGVRREPRCRIRNVNPAVILRSSSRAVELFWTLGLLNRRVPPFAESGTVAGKALSQQWYRDVLAIEETGRHLSVK